MTFDSISVHHLVCVRAAPRTRKSAAMASSASARRPTRYSISPCAANNRATASAMAELAPTINTFASQSLITRRQKLEENRDRYIR